MSRLSTFCRKGLGAILRIMVAVSRVSAEAVQNERRRRPTRVLTAKLPMDSKAQAQQRPAASGEFA